MYFFEEQDKAVTMETNKPQSPRVLAYKEITKPKML